MTPTETAPPPVAGPIELDDQRPGETLPDYQTRVLRFALRFGIARFTLSQLETADARAQLAVVTLSRNQGKDLDADGIRLDETLHTLRLRLQTALEARRKALKNLERELATLDENAAQEAARAQEDGNQDQDQNQDSDQDRAVRLLRAALTLILDAGTDQGGGGRRARLQPRPPDKGPGSYADDRTRRRF